MNGLSSKPSWSTYNWQVNLAVWQDLIKLDNFHHFNVVFIYNPWLWSFCTIHFHQVNYVTSTIRCSGRFLGIIGQNPRGARTNPYTGFLEAGLFCPSQILGFPSPTGYMFVIFQFSLPIWGIFYRFLLKWWVMFLKSWTSGSDFSNSTSSSVTRYSFSQFVATILTKVFCFYFKTNGCCPLQGKHTTTR